MVLRFSPHSSDNFNPRAPCGARPQQSDSTLHRPLFQPTRPLRGATGLTILLMCVPPHFNPRAPCGARQGVNQLSRNVKYFNPRAPCGARPELRAPVSAYHCISTHAPLAGRDEAGLSLFKMSAISTHAPLAGRDRRSCFGVLTILYFNPRAPCGARRYPIQRRAVRRIISTHAPLAGRDPSVFAFPPLLFISTHAPLAGRDQPR